MRCVRWMLVLLAAWPVAHPAAAETARSVHVRFGGDFDVEYPLQRLRMVSEVSWTGGQNWTLGTGTSLGAERIDGQRVTDISAAPAFLATLLLVWPLALWSEQDGELDSWALLPLHLVALPQAHLDLHGGARRQWFLGAGLHGRLITTSALFEKEEEGFEAENGLLFTPGLRAGVALGRLRVMAIYGRRQWLREGQRWHEDGTELRLRVDWAGGF